MSRLWYQTVRFLIVCLHRRCFSWDIIGSYGNSCCIMFFYGSRDVWTFSGAKLLWANFISTLWFQNTSQHITKKSRKLFPLQLRQHSAKNTKHYKRVPLSIERRSAAFWSMRVLVHGISCWRVGTASGPVRYEMSGNITKWEEHVRINRKH